MENVKEGNRIKLVKPNSVGVTKNYVEKEILDSLEFEKPILYDGRWIMKGKPDFTNGNKEYYQAIDINDFTGEHDGLEVLWKSYKSIHGYTIN